MPQSDIPNKQWKKRPLIYRFSYALVDISAGVKTLPSVCTVSSWSKLPYEVALAPSLGTWFWGCHQACNKLLDCSLHPPWIRYAIAKPSFFHNALATGWIFPPDVTCTQHSNHCWHSYFDIFQFYFMAGVCYLVSLETAVPQQIKQSGFNVITQTILWP